MACLGGPHLLEEFLHQAVDSISSIHAVCASMLLYECPMCNRAEMMFVVKYAGNTKTVYVLLYKVGTLQSM